MLRRGKIERQAVLLLIVNALFAAASALSGTFVNVYLWKSKNDFAMIGWFALSGQIAMALTFWLAGKWVKEHNKMNSLRLGMAVSAAFYLVVLSLGKSSIDYVALLGVLMGMANGFFWLAFNVVYFEVTDPDNRDSFNGWAGLSGSAAGMVGPWVSGLLITRLHHSQGYRLIFAISLGIFAAGVVLSFFLKKRKTQQTYDWLHPIHILKERGNPWRSVVPALVAQGVREGVFGFMIGLMVYIATNNEMKLGNFSLITSAVAFASFWLIGKLLKPRYRNSAMLISTLVMTAVIVPFFWKVNYSTLLIFGIGTALFIPLFTIPMTSSVFDLIGKDEMSASKRVEYVVLRELGLNAGRILGTCVFIAVVSRTMNVGVMNALMLILGSFFILSWAFMSKLLKKGIRSEIQ